MKGDMLNAKGVDQAEQRDSQLLLRLELDVLELVRSEVVLLA